MTSRELGQYASQIESRNDAYSTLIDDGDSADSSLFAVNTHRNMDDNFRRTVQANDITAKNLLEASLMSLRPSQRRTGPKLNSRSAVGEKVSRSDQTSYKEGFPSEAFLSGALWFGRNLAVSMDRLAEEIVAAKNRIASHLLEIDIDSGHDSRNEVIEKSLKDIASLSDSSIRKVKAYLHELSTIEPGDSWKLFELQNKLPLDRDYSAASQTPGRREKAAFMSPGSLSSSPIMRSTNTGHTPNTTMYSRDYRDDEYLYR
jgi:hypothetical protein